MPTYLILSLDGGGIRGLLTAALLERLVAARPGWLDKADLLAGTSTGGIIALGLAYGLTPTDLRKLYELKGKAIFDDSWLDDVADLGKLTGADYSNRNLTKELKRIFGKDRLGDLRKRVLIASFDLQSDDPDPAMRCWKPKFFHNFPGPDSDADQPIWKVALYTSAAPTYFPSVDGYIDGGVVANNPSMAALAQTQDRRSVKPPPALDDIALLSVGTGASRVSIAGKDLDWGYAQWAKPLISLMLDGVMGVADYQCRQILRDNYHRLDPQFSPGQVIAMDDINKVPALLALAEQAQITPTTTWLKKHWAQALHSRPVTQHSGTKDPTWGPPGPRGADCRGHPDAIKSGGGGE